MPSALWAALAPLVVLVLWLVCRRQPRPLLRSTDTSAVASLNRAQLVSRMTPAVAQEHREAPAAGLAAPLPAMPAAVAAAASTLPPLPRTAAQRQAYLQQLRQWSAGDAGERLRAVQAAAHWHHPLVLPVLRRALRDVDPRVMAAAAAAIAPYRSGRQPVQASGAALPRKVSRTR